MRLSPDQKRYVLNKLKTEGTTCPQCSSQEFVFDDKESAWRTWSNEERYMVPLGCANGCLGGILVPIDGPIPNDPGALA